MSAVESRMHMIKEWVSEHRGVILAVIAVIAAILLIVGLTLSWFLTNKDLSTVGKVQLPATLKVLGPNQTATEQLDFTYDADKDYVDAGGNVHRKRAFCVQSNGEGFELQVANTTNIKNMSVNVYRVTVNKPDADGDVVDYDGLNSRYSWSKKGDALSFNFINQDKEDPSIAIGPSGDDPTFYSYKDVQKNASPLYRWTSIKELDSQDANSATNFIIECTWPKDTNVKETDIVYVIARTA